MATSQEDFAYSPHLLAALSKRIAPARLRRYLVDTDGDEEWALKLYLWNARLAKSYLYPLHVAEVVTRNSVDAALVASPYGAGWLTDGKVTLTTDSIRSRNAALERLVRERKREELTPPQHNDNVAALTFDFWSNLFRKDYDAVWSSHNLLSAVFPRLPRTCGRHDVQLLVKEVNKLRNRVAHHEPVYQYKNHEQKLNQIVKLVDWQCGETAEWIRRHSTVIAEARARPTRLSGLPGPLLSSVDMRRPPFFTLDDTILSALGKLTSDRLGMGLLDINQMDGPCHRLITLKDLLTHGVIESGGGYMNFGERTLGELLPAIPFHRLLWLDRTMTTSDARAAFFPRKTKALERPAAIVVVGGNRTTANVRGLIPHPIVRY